MERICSRVCEYSEYGYPVTGIYFTARTYLVIGKIIQEGSIGFEDPKSQFLLDRAGGEKPELERFYRQF